MSQNLALESAVWAKKGKQLYIYKNKFDTVPLICWIEPQIVIKPPLGFTVKFKTATIIPLQVFFLLIPHYLATNFIVGTRLFNYFWNPIKLADHFLWNSALARLVFPPTTTIDPSCKYQIFWMFKEENCGTDECNWRIYVMQPQFIIEFLCFIERLWLFWLTCLEFMNQ